MPSLSSIVLMARITAPDGRCDEGIDHAVGSVHDRTDGAQRRVHHQHVAGRHPEQA